MRFAPARDLRLPRREAYRVCLGMSDLIRIKASMGYANAKIEAIDQEIVDLRSKRDLIKNDYAAWSGLYFGLREKRRYISEHVKMLDAQALKIEREEYTSHRRAPIIGETFLRGPNLYGQDETLKKFGLEQLKDKFPIQVARAHAHWLRRKAMVRMRELTGKTYKEIADFFKCTPGRVQQIVARAELDEERHRTTRLSPIELYFRGKDEFPRCARILLKRDYLFKKSPKISVVPKIVDEMG